MTESDTPCNLECMGAVHCVFPFLTLINTQKPASALPIQAQGREKKILSGATGSCPRRSRFACAAEEVLLLLSHVDQASLIFGEGKKIPDFSAGTVPPLRADSLTVFCIRLCFRPGHTRRRNLPFSTCIKCSVNNPALCGRKLTCEILVFFKQLLAVFPPFEGVQTLLSLEDAFFFAGKFASADWYLRHFSLSRSRFVWRVLVCTL